MITFAELVFLAHVGLFDIVLMDRELTAPPSVPPHPAGGQESQLEFEFDASMSVLTIRKPGMNVGEDWSVALK